jgi:hypothetical protein
MASRLFYGIAHGGGIQQVSGQTQAIGIAGERVADLGKRWLVEVHQREALGMYGERSGYRTAEVSCSAGDEDHGMVEVGHGVSRRVG